jgi:hypothetical protein
VKSGDYLLSTKTAPVFMVKVEFLRHPVNNLVIMVLLPGSTTLSGETKSRGSRGKQIHCDAPVAFLSFRGKHFTPY